MDIKKKQERIKYWVISHEITSMLNYGISLIKIDDTTNEVYVEHLSKLQIFIWIDLHSSKWITELFIDKVTACIICDFDYPSFYF